ncbi:hypothetical protein F5883DRAFT_227089 [Diaporthe sp. PMI_573]|nr:hypothetical protein F5883DRAFT_227089 [Diaporthaceae sp. PMI_573]
MVGLGISPTGATRVWIIKSFSTVVTSTACVGLALASTVQQPVNLFAGLSHPENTVHLTSHKKSSSSISEQLCSCDVFTGQSGFRHTEKLELWLFWARYYSKYGVVHPE